MTDKSYDEPKSHEPAHAPAKPAAASRNPTKDAPEPVPAASQLLPASATVGDPTFALQVIGSLFTQQSVITLGGKDAKTNFVTDQELTTIIDMSKWVDPDPKIPVVVRTGDHKTDPLTFALNPKA